MVWNRLRVGAQWICGGILLGMMGCATQEAEVSAPPEPETPGTVVQRAGPKRVYALGEAFAIRDEETDVMITFSRSRKHEGEEFLKPKENHYWYYLKGTVKNQSDKEFVISPDFYTLTDGKKKTYEPSVRSHAIKNIRVLQGIIKPTSEKTAEIGFELPKGSEPVQLSFDISNYTACNDIALRGTHFCKPILIKLVDERG